MEHFFYPGPGAKIYHHGKWESWNKLRVATPSRKKSRNNSFSSQLDPKLQSASNKKFLNTNANNYTEISPRAFKPKQAELTQRFYSKNPSVLTIDELLLLEHDLFAETKQVKMPLFLEELKTSQKKTATMVLNGKKIRATPIKVFRPKNHSYFKKLALPKPTKLRSSSVNKKIVKKKGIETPSPWGHENSIENLSNFQKPLVYSKVPVQDNFTST